MISKVNVTQKDVVDQIVTDNAGEVTSVAGKIGAVTLAKSDVGLSNVDNTSDVDKPISSATQTALNAKESVANKGAVNGYAGLGSDSRVSQVNLPGLAIALHYLVGDGNDGNLVFDGVSTVLGITPSNNFYMLNRDIYAANLTINAGVKINTNGYRVFVRGTLANNGGALHMDGNTPPGAPSGASGYNNQGSLSISSGNGGGGKNGNGIGGNGNNPPGNNSVSGASGGNGGAGGGNNGGNGATGASITANQGSIRDIGFMIRGRLLGNVAGNGGNGAGGGGCTLNTGTANSGGGGSGGGGVAIVCLTLNNTGVISANGGKGSNAAGTGNAVAGGGGGGGGGWVFVAASIIVNQGTITASGGTGGTGYNGGGTGATGGGGVVVVLTPSGL